MKANLTLSYRNTNEPQTNKRRSLTQLFYDLHHELRFGNQNISGEFGCGRKAVVTCFTTIATFAWRGNVTHNILQDYTNPNRTPFNSIFFTNLMHKFFFKITITLKNKNKESVHQVGKKKLLPYFPAHKMHLFFPHKRDLNSTCVLCAKGKYYFQTYKYPHIYYTASLS
jgi:hypothetical protein